MVPVPCRISASAAWVAPISVEGLRQALLRLVDEDDVRGDVRHHRSPMSVACVAAVLVPCDGSCA